MALKANFATSQANTGVVVVDATLERAAVIGKVFSTLSSAAALLDALAQVVFQNYYSAIVSLLQQRGDGAGLACAQLQWPLIDPC